MSEEELASLYFAVGQLSEVSEKHPGKGEEFFRSGLAATEHLDEGARVRWQRFCETGGQAAVSDFYKATEGKVSPSGTPWEVKVLFDGPKPPSSRIPGLRFHFNRLASESEKKALSERLPRPKRR